MKSPRPPSSPEAKESSVVISLQELVRLERARVEDEARARAEREAQGQEQRRADERRRVERERLRREAEAARAHEAELRARMDDAQIEAAKLAELENRKLAQQQQLHLERLAVEERHAREMAKLQAAQAKPFPTAVVAGVVTALVALAISLFFLLPRTKAKAPDDGTDAQRAADARAADARAEKQDRQIKELLGQLDALEKQPLPSASTAAAPPPPSTKPKPNVPVAPRPKDEGCTVEIAGVPMCSKKP